MIIISDVIANTLRRINGVRRSRLIRLTKQAEEGLSARPVSTEQRRARLGELIAEMGSAHDARTMLERMIGGNDLSPINYLSRGSAVARSVCRVHLQDSSGQTTGFGTGFLVAPGVLMTNHHVIGSATEAANAMAEFDYELDVQGRERQRVEFQILTDPAPVTFQDLDFCIVSVAPRSRDGLHALSDYSWLPLDPTPGKAFVGEYLTIIQHPGGERKQICVRENKLLKYDEAGTTLWYQTDTVAGSSGSPVYNNSWQIVALHHSGIPKTDSKGRWLTTDGKLWDESMGESRVAWIANEGIRISRILEYLRTQQGDQPLAQRVLNAASAPLPAEMTNHATNGINAKRRLENGLLHIPLPAEIVVQLGALSGLDARPNGAAIMGANGQAAASTTPISKANGAANTLSLTPRIYPTGVESVTVDQSNYAARTGYDSRFLGKGALEVPLPKIKAAAGSILKFKAGNSTTSELKYWNYSVVMHRTRRLAFYSAVNVDASLRPEGAGRDGDVWYADTRIPAGNQIGAEFYGEQKTFEAERTKNPFDRGHLSRRLDVQWGKTPALAKRNGDDSFHWTNCSPQHWQFNQGTKRWLGMEDYVISVFSKDTRRACVINGPLFDAPLSLREESGRIQPQLRGKSHKDPTFGGISIPKLFFKVVATRGASGLVAAAFLMSQEDFLLGVDRLHGMPQPPEEILSTAEARLYQVSVADIEHLTQLDFGPLADADTKTEEVALGAPRPIINSSDIRL